LRAARWAALVSTLAAASSLPKPEPWRLRLRTSSTPARTQMLHAKWSSTPGRRAMLHSWMLHSWMLHTMQHCSAWCGAG
jgi:hypothetical protein